MNGRYLRNLPALTGEECALLRSKRVLVVGCGGLGGYIIEFLSRLAVGSLRLVDGDCFEKTNLNRQLLSLPCLLGKPKAEAAAERVRLVNPDVEVEAYCVFFDENNAEQLVSGCDIVLDALDNIESRRVLSQACKKQGVPLVYGAISGWVAQAAVSMPGDGFIDMLFPNDVEIKDKSVLPFTPALCAAMQCALAARLLCGRKIKSGTLNYFDLLDMEFETIDMA